jgi:hypothetical protein
MTGMACVKGVVEAVGRKALTRVDNIAVVEGKNILP